MDGTVNLANKEITSIESNCTSEHKEGNGHDKSVSKVKHTRDKLSDFQGCSKIKDGIQEHVECRGS